MAGRLAGKLALVTGAATGIGRAAVQKFVAEGAKVVVADINEKGANEYLPALGDAASFIRCDVTQETDVEKAVKTAVERLGGLSIVVNNAGLLIHKLVTDVDTASWDKVFAVNVRSAFFTARYAIPHLKKAGSAAIVSMSSIAGLRGGPGATAYASAKAAVNGLTVSLALEYAADNIRVNSICPGWIDTPFNQPAIDFMGGTEAQARFIKSHTPMGRQGTPEEVAALITYLASDEAAFVTGQAISINGGAYN